MIAARPERFEPRFVDVVTVIAQALPVLPVPELHHVTAMRVDVIDKRSNARTSRPEIDAPRIDGQERLALLAPSVIVSTLMRGAPSHGAVQRARRVKRSHHEQGLRRRRSRAAKLSTVCLVRSPLRFEL